MLRDVVGASSPAKARLGGPVVVIANRLPFPIDDGWKARTFHVIQQIASRRPTTLLTFGASARQDRSTAFTEAVGTPIGVVTVPPPRPYTMWRLALGAVTRTPVYVWNNSTRGFRDALEGVIADTQASLGVAVCTFMYPYFQRVRFPGPVIIDTHNLDSELMRRYATYLRGPRRWYASRTVSRLAGLEARAFPEASEVWVCSTEERDHIAARYGVDAGVVPNGVDCSRFAAIGGREVPGRLLFFGTMNYRPNQDGLRYFLDEVLPLLRHTDPDVHLRVVGRGAPPVLIERCRTTPGVEYVGLVSDIRDELATASIVVVPLRMGGGTRLKILEALASGRPVVSTTVGAEGLHLEAGRQIVLADEARAFALEVHRLLADRPRRDRIAAAGRAAARARYDWAAVGEMIGARLADAERIAGSRDRAGGPE